MDDQRVGPHRRHVERHGAHGLRAVDDEGGTGRTCPRADPDEIEQGAVGPVRLLDGDQDRARVDRGQHGVVPQGRAALARSRGGPGGVGCRHGAQLDAKRAPAAPRIDVARELLAQHDDVLAAPDLQVAGDDRHAVGHRRHQGHGFGVGMDELGAQAADPLGRGEEVGGRDVDRKGAPGQGRNPGLLRGQGQQAHIGAVQPAIGAVQGEQIFLAGERRGHGVDS